MTTSTAAVKRPSQMSDDEVARKDNAEMVPGLRWGIRKDGLWAARGKTWWVKDPTKATSFGWRDTAAGCLADLAGGCAEYQAATVASFSLPGFAGTFAIQKCTPRGPYWLAPSTHGVNWSWKEDEVIRMNRSQAEGALRVLRDQLPEAFGEAFIVALGEARN